MAARMTEKENLMKVIHGEIPEWVPRISIAQRQMMPAFTLFGSTNEKGNRVDMFGVEYVATKDTGGMALPVPNQFILEDVTEWLDVIKLPDISDLDWEAIAKKDLEKVDRNEYAVALGTNGYFLNLMNFMGFTEGLCAMYEEPEAVIDLFEYMSEFDCEMLRKGIEAYHPDIVGMGDDIATATEPFVSLPMYRELVRPYHARIAAIAKEYDLPVDMHCCGRSEDFIDDWMEFGVTVWNPAQIMNDLQGIKAKYGRDLVLCGCWDYSGPVGQAGATEEFVRSEVRKCLDTYAVDGGFIFWNYVLGHTNHPDLADKLRWIDEEVYSYGHQFYK